MVLELRPRPGMAPLVVVAAGTLMLAVLLGAVANSAFVARYTAVVLPLFLLVVATGRGGAARPALPGWRAWPCWSSPAFSPAQAENGQQRTQAGQIAAVLNVQAQPGDLVVYCPDQLGPAVDRLLRVPGVTEITFPRAIGPQRVDWVDYKKVIAATDVDTFAQAALARVPSGPHPVAGLAGRLPGSGRRLRLPEELARPAASDREPPSCTSTATATSSSRTWSATPRERARAAGSPGRARGWPAG